MLACWVGSFVAASRPACDLGPNSAGARGNKMAISLPCLRIVRLWQHQFESGPKGATRLLSTCDLHTFPAHDGWHSLDKIPLLLLIWASETRHVR